MGDDPFERMLRREEEIRRRLQSGEIDAEEADELRDLAGTDAEAERDGRLRLTLDQVTRIADEGVDAAVLRALLDVNPSLSVDDAIALCAEYDPDIGCIRDLGRSGLRPQRRQIADLWDAGVSADTLAATAAYGCGDPVATAVMLTERTDDPSRLLHELTDFGVGALRHAELERIADHGIEPDVLAKMLVAAPDLTPDEAIDLCIEEIDPDVVERLRIDGIELDTERLRQSTMAVSLINVRIGRRQLVVGAGSQRIRQSGRVDGIFLGDVTINPGLDVELAATVLGDLHIEPGAHVVVTGRVLGAVDRRAGADDAVPR